MIAAGQPVVSVVIVSFNHMDDLRVLLESIAARVSEPAVEVIVVDNASHEPVAATIVREFPWVRLIAHAVNVGFGAGCNAGARAARGDFLLFVNSDIIFRGNPVPGMLRVFTDDPSTGIVGLTLLNEDGSLQPSGFRFPSIWLRILQLSGLKRIILKVMRSREKASGNPFPDFVTGAFFVIPRTLFDEIGGFDERYFMYIEDADLGFRVRRNGKNIRLLPPGDVIHLGRHYEDSGTPFVFLRMNDGLILFYRTHYGVVRSMVLAVLSIIVFAGRWVGALVVSDGSSRRGMYASAVRSYARALADVSRTGVPRT